MHVFVFAALCVLVSAQSARALPDHPFLLWTPDEAAAIRKVIETEEWAKTRYAALLAESGRGGVFRNLFRYQVMGDLKVAEAEKAYLLKIIGTHPRQYEGKLDHGGRHYDCHQDALRYDVLYDLLTPEERGKVEETFRTYIDYQLTDTKNYTRTSWLPNMQWPRPMAAFIMAVVLRDRGRIESTWNSRCGFKWYMDEYLADKGFYMEEFGKQYSMVGAMLLYCRGLERLGLDAMGYGYTGKGGATMRGYVESVLWAGYPRVDLGTTRPAYPKVTMGDARGGGPAGAPPYVFAHTIVSGFMPSGEGGNESWVSANMNGRDHREAKVDKMREPHWFEIGHAKWPDAGFDYFLAQMRPPDADRYVPSLFWGVTPIDPAAVKPPAAPSYVSKERGFAVLRAEESPAYWESPAPAVALQLGLYYVHYTHDAFSLLGMVADNRPIYFNRGIADGYAGGDPWTDSARGHCTPCVDGLQPQPVGQLPTRHAFDPLVKFVAVTDDPAASGGRIRNEDNREIEHTKTVYPDATVLRALFLTREYLLDVVRLRSEKPRQYDWQVHALGLPVCEGAGWTSSDDLSGGALYAALPAAMAAKAKGDPERYDLKQVQRLSADNAAWQVRALQRCALEDVAQSRMGADWYAKEIGVRVGMLPEPGTVVYAGRSAEYVQRAGAEPGKGTRGDVPNEVGGTTLMVRREASETAFVALHEPFVKNNPALHTFERIAQDPAGVVVRIAGGDVDDRAILQYGPDLSEPVMMTGAGEKYVFRGHGHVRIGKDQVRVSGGLVALEISVNGAPELIVNGQKHRAEVKDGRLAYP